MILKLVEDTIQLVNYEFSACVLSDLYTYSKSSYTYQQYHVMEQFVVMIELQAFHNAIFGYSKNTC